MIALLGLQLGLPVLLAGVALGLPALSLVGRIAQLAALGAITLALVIAGLWLLPPWWFVWLYALAFLAALALAFLTPPRAVWPRRATSWGATLVLLAVTVVVGREAALGLLGRRLPDEPAVSLTFPLRDGHFLVVNGGTTDRVSSHVATLDPSFRGYRDYRGQSYAVDIVQLNGWGAASAGIFPGDPRKWRIYGTPVFAPCSGAVKHAEDGIPDTPVPVQDRRNMTGNSVLLDCGEFEVLLAHLAPGSVQVQAGQPIRTGQLLGRVGNTGNTGGPHLHMHAQRRSPTSALIAGDPLPMRIDGRFLVRNDHVIR